MARGKKQPIKRQSKRIKDAKPNDTNAAVTATTAQTKMPANKIAKKPVPKKPHAQKKNDDNVDVNHPPPPRWYDNP